MSNTWNHRILLVLLVLSSACAGQTGAEDEISPEASGPQERSAIQEVSPELFELVRWWSRDAELDASISERGGSRPLSLEHFVSLHQPSLLAEVQALESSGADEGVSQMSVCGCQLLATVDANPVNRQTEYENYDTSGEKHRWTAEALGAAHRGEFYRYKYHGLTAHEKDRQHHTQMRFQLMCRDGQGNYCEGSCQAKMYVYSEYGTRLYGWGNTGGIWDKAAHAAVADGVKLTYAAPYQTSLTLFEKAGSVSHHANKTAFNVDEAINVVKGALQIYAALKTSDAGGALTADSELISKTIKSLAKLIHRSGNNGSTERELYAAYNSTQEGFFNVNYSSSSAQVHSVRLTSQARVKNRGWGGTNEDRTRYASSYLLAVAVDHFACGSGLSAPSRGGIWRYASVPSAPYTAPSLQSMTQSFFNVMGIHVNAQHASGNSWTDGCVPSQCQAGQCGYVSNGCGGTMYCGACAYCGDGSCSGAETCRTCPGDCGDCCSPTQPC